MAEHINGHNHISLTRGQEHEPLTTDPNMLILMRQCADVMLNVSNIIVQFTERQAAIELRLEALEQGK